MRKVTVYIPCYNASDTIKECLESMINQTYPIEEIIVIDDGSTDNSVNLIRQYPVKVLINKKNKGLAYCRNICFRTAACEFVAALDSDCVAAPNWLEQLMDVINDDGIAGAGGRLTERYASSLADKWRAIHMAQGWGDGILIDPPFLYGSNTVFRREVASKIGLYNENFVTNFEDVEFSERIYACGLRLIYNPEARVEHLRHDTVISVLKNYGRWSEQYYLFRYMMRTKHRNKIRRICARIGDASEQADTLKYFFQQDLLNKNHFFIHIYPLFFLYLFCRSLKLVMKELL